MPEPRAGIVHDAIVDEDTTPDTKAQDEPSTVEPPMAQYTPRAAEKPVPVTDTTLPATTAERDTEVTFITDTSSTITELPDVKSCPFTETSTVVLPATPATDTHSVD